MGRVVVMMAETEVQVEEHRQTLVQVKRGAQEPVVKGIMEEIHLEVRGTILQEVGEGPVRRVHLQQPTPVLVEMAEMEPPLLLQEAQSLMQEEVAEHVIVQPLVREERVVVGMGEVLPPLVRMD